MDNKTNNPSKPTRDHKVDILKGIGIIMMTLGHCHAPCRYTFYLFHVAIFFIASGYFFRSSNSDSFGSAVKYTFKKFKALWLPYFLTIAILALTHNLQLKIGILTENPAVLELTNGDYDYEMLSEHWGIGRMFNNIIRGFFFGGGVSFAGNIWFLRVLLMISVVYCGSSFILKLLFPSLLKPVNTHESENNGKSDKTLLIFQTVISIAFLAIGFLMQKKNVFLFGIATFFSCYILYHIGVIIGRYRNKTPFMFYLIAGIVSIVILTVLYRLRIGIFDIGLVANEYPDPIFLVIVSTSGWFAVYLFSILFDHVPVIGPFLTLCGENSLLIMILHPICFKFVNFIEAKVYGLPRYHLAVYPVIYSDKLWWLLCTVFGVFVPLGLSLGYKKLRSILNR